MNFVIFYKLYNSVQIIACIINVFLKRSGSNEGSKKQSVGMCVEQLLHTQMKEEKHSKSFIVHLWSQLLSCSLVKKKKKPTGDKNRKERLWQRGSWVTKLKEHKEAERDYRKDEFIEIQS